VWSVRPFFGDVSLGLKHEPELDCTLESVCNSKERYGLIQGSVLSTDGVGSESHLVFNLSPTGHLFKFWNFAIKCPEPNSLKESESSAAMNEEGYAQTYYKNNVK
jgi:hypothetical protein